LKREMRRIGFGKNRRLPARLPGQVPLGKWEGSSWKILSPNKSFSFEKGEEKSRKRERERKFYKKVGLPSTSDRKVLWKKHGCLCVFEEERGGGHKKQQSLVFQESTPSGRKEFVVSRKEDASTKGPRHKMG